MGSGVPAMCPFLFPATPPVGETGPSSLSPESHCVVCFFPWDTGTASENSWSAHEGWAWAWHSPQERGGPWEDVHLTEQKQRVALHDPGSMLGGSVRKGRVNQACEPEAQRGVGEAGSRGLGTGGPSKGPASWEVKFGSIWRAEEKEVVVAQGRPQRWQPTRLLRRHSLAPAWASAFQGPECLLSLSLSSVGCRSLAPCLCGV